MLNDTLDELLRKLKQHDMELLHLSDNVFDYSYKEMASNFEERVDNRLTNIKQQIQEMVKSISNLNKLKREDEPLSTLTEKIQKMVERRLECFTNKVDQKLISLAHSHGTNFSAPSESLDGKRILYKSGEDYLEPNEVMTSIDGSLLLKGDRKDHSLVSSKNKTRTDQTRSSAPHSSFDSKESRKKQSNYARLKPIREKNKRKLEEQKKSRKEDTIQSHGNIYFKDHHHSMQQPGSSCKFGEKCWNKNCDRRHPNSPGQPIDH